MKATTSGGIGYFSGSAITMTSQNIIVQNSYANGGSGGSFYFTNTAASSISFTNSPYFETSKA